MDDFRAGGRLIRCMCALFLGGGALNPVAGFAQQTPAPAPVERQAPPAPAPVPVELPNYREPLRDMVRTLADYAHARDPRLLVLTREGLGLAIMQEAEAKIDRLTQKAEESFPVAAVGSVVRRYVRSFDGVVMDGQFCGDKATASAAFIQALQTAGLGVLSLDRCATAAEAEQAYAKARALKVVPRLGLLGDEKRSFSTSLRVWGENPDNVVSLAEAKNVVVLEEGGEEGSKAAWILAIRESNADMVVLPAFWRDRDPLTREEVVQLKTKKVGTRRLLLARMNVAYARDAEYYWKASWRPGEPAWLGAPVASQAGTFRVKYWDPGWRDLVGRMFVALIDLGFDGVVLEGVDAYRDFEGAASGDGKGRP